jgi:hypothetical protein
LVPIFRFCAPGLVFGGTEGVGTRFYVLRARTRFRRYRGRRLPFSYFARPDSFSTIPMTSSPIFMFCVPELVFGGTESVGSRFHVLRARTHFRRYGGRRVPFSCFARLDSFPAIPRALAPVFKFYVPGLIFSSTEVVGYRFQVLRSRTHFRRYRERRHPFSCFALPDPFRRYRRRWSAFTCFARLASFSAVPRVSATVFMICAPGLVFDGIEGVGSRF